MIDEILRAVFGMACCYPAMAMAAKWRLKPIPSTVLVTVWSVPVWKLYAVLGGWLCG